MRKYALLLFLLVTLHTQALATWSVIAIDRKTGQVVIASATCVPQQAFAGFPAKGLKDVQAIIIPGVGVAAAQANVDRTRLQRRIDTRYLDVIANDLEHGVQLVEDARKNKQALSVGVVGNAAHTHPALLKRGFKPGGTRGRRALLADARPARP